MKRFASVVIGIALAMSAMAEASFDQIEGLIQQKNYAAAAAGLEVIVQNHPKSAKAFYAMAQAQAGLGNLDKAQKALNIATGLNPTLDFAPSSSVQSLKQAITPQTAKIEAVEESHFWRNFAYGALFGFFGVACYFLYVVYARKQEEEAAAEKAGHDAELERIRTERAARDRAAVEQAEKEIAEYNAKQEALKAHKNYGKAGFDPANPDKLKTKAQLKQEADEAARVEAEREARTQRLRAEAAEADAYRARLNASNAASGPAHTTVVNNSGNDMLTGIMIGNMIGNSGHHHDSERVVTREVVREVPAPSRDSTWDDTPAPSKSSSWDDSSSKSSSSWSSSSDSSSSSSWDSGSSSSDSGSSSWD